MTRFRRLRKTENIRGLVRETNLAADDLIQPFFVVEGKNKKEPIETMPGMSRYSIDNLIKAVGRFYKAGGKAGLFFGLPHKKDSLGSQAYTPAGVIPKAIKAVKKEFPHFVIMTDVCLCAYTDHGHCGVIQEGEIHNDKTVALLGRMAVVHAGAGADIVAPSDMMDLRVAQIRRDLDKNGFENTAILSYAVKYHSAFYGPFREAARSSPKFGDRKTYQMDYANRREALKEARQDIDEGADILMVKPALPYLDVISLLRVETTVPL